MKKTSAKAKKTASKKPAAKVAAKKSVAKKAAVKKPAPKKVEKKAEKKTAKAATSPKRDGLQDFVHASLSADKAQDIISIDLRGKTAIADHMLVATGTSSRHIASMATRLRDKLSVEKKIKARVEGADSGDWVIVDVGDIIVHLFRKEVREFYNLEKLWGADFSTVAYTRYQTV